MARPKNFGLSKPLKTRTVLKNFKADESMTFDVLAEEYGMVENLAKFLELLHKAVGNENFSDMERINAKRMKKGKGTPVIVNDYTEVKQDFKAQAQTQKKTTETVNKEELTMKEIAKTQEEIADIEQLISFTVIQLDAAQVLVEDITKQAAEQKALVDKLSAELEAAKKVLIDIESEMNDNTVQLKNFEDELFTLNERKVALEEELKAMTVVYLLAPKFHGRIKTKEGRNYVSTVSTVQSISTKCENVPKEEWVSQPSLEEMVAVGYDSFSEYMEAFAFVQLVLSYKLNNKAFELVCNSKKVLAMLDYEWEKKGS